MNGSNSWHIHQRSIVRISYPWTAGGISDPSPLNDSHPTDHVMIGTQKKSFQKGHLLFLIDFGILGWVSYSKTISFRGSRLLNQLDERPKSHVGSPTLTLTNEETQDFANWDVNQDNKTKAGGFIHFPKVFMEWWPQLAHFFGSGFPTVCMIIWMARAQGLLPPGFGADQIDWDQRSRTHGRWKARYEIVAGRLGMWSCSAWHSSTSNVGTTMPYCLYHLFMVIWGMIYNCFTHIMVSSKWTVGLRVWTQIWNNCFLQDFFERKRATAWGSPASDEQDSNQSGRIERHMEQDLRGRISNLVGPGVIV